MHLDKVVKDRFVRVDEEARHEGIPLGGCKALQVFRIIVGPSWGTPGDGGGRDPPEGEGPQTQGAEELFPLQIGQERWRGRLRRIGLQVKQRGPVGAFWDREQAIDGLTQRQGELGGHGLQEGILGMGRDRGDQPFEGGPRWRNHLPGTQKGVGKDSDQKRTDR
jgi:hypothetical protein